MFGTQKKTAYKKIVSSKNKKIKKFENPQIKSSYFHEDFLVWHRFQIYRGHDFKDFAEFFDRIENIAPRVCMVSLTHPGGLLDIRKSHLRAGG